MTVGRRQNSKALPAATGGGISHSSRLFCLLLSLSLILAAPFSALADTPIAGQAKKSADPAVGPGASSAAAAGAVASPVAGSAASSAAADSTVRLAEPITLTDVSAERHDDNKTLNLTPLYLSTAVEMHSFRALRSESSFDQSIRLRDAINYVLDHGMQIKLSRESLVYQHWATMAQCATALPSFLLSYSLTNSDVYNKSTTSIGRQFYTGVNFPVFAGGGTLAGILTQHYREKAWKNTYKSTYQDVFLSVYQDY